MSELHRQADRCFMQCCVAAEIRFANPATAHKKAGIQHQPKVARRFWRVALDHKFKAIFQRVDHGPSDDGAWLRIFSETLEMVMATPPRPTAGPTDLNELLHFNPHIIADPVPWWWLQHLDKAQLSKLAQISMARQKEVLAAQTKALDAAMKTIGE